MKKTIIVLSLIIIVIFIAGCINRNTPISFSGDISLELRIYDSLPKSLTLQNDGTLIFTERGNTASIKLSPEEVESLKQFIIDNNFFSLKEKYPDRGMFGIGRTLKVMDGIGFTITVTIGDKSHSVDCSAECPEGFYNVLEKIEGLWPEKIQHSGWA